MKTIKELSEQQGKICEQLQALFKYEYAEINNQDDALESHLRNNDKRNLALRLIQNQFEIEYEILMKVGFTEKELLPKMTIKTFWIEDIGNILTNEQENKEDVKWVD